MSNKEIY